jgi:DNA-directed RNA polymerase subunit RPC12/RpoP
MNIYEQLAKAGAKVTYFCAYCGYVFEDPPKLTAKCPRCRRKLTEFSKPLVEPATAKPRVDLRQSLQKRTQRKRWG